MLVARSRHTLLAVAVLVAMMLVAACGGGGSGSVARDSTSVSPSPSTSTSGATVTTYFAQYGASTHAFKPHRLNPSIDGSLYVRDVQWQVWDSDHAVGVGVAHVNDCLPDCADGHYATHQVTVHLTRPRETCGARFFTAIRLSGPGYRTRTAWSGILCR